MNNTLKNMLGLVAIALLIFVAYIAIQLSLNNLDYRTTVISGVLSMVGGIAGAFGAYYVAANQMYKQFEYEKKKEKKQRKETIEQSLKKLELLNKEAIEFIDFFREHYSGRVDDLKRVRLDFSEKDLFWIVNIVNNLNDEVLMDNYALDYLRFNREINNMYIDVSGLNSAHKQLSESNLISLIESMLERRKVFSSFDEYLKEHIGILQKELKDLN